MFTLLLSLYCKNFSVIDLENLSITLVSALISDFANFYKLQYFTIRENVLGTVVNIDIKFPNSSTYII